MENGSNIIKRMKKEQSNKLSAAEARGPARERETFDENNNRHTMCKRVDAERERERAAATSTLINTFYQQY